MICAQIDTFQVTRGNAPLLGLSLEVPFNYSVMLVCGFVWIILLWKDDLRTVLADTTANVIEATLSCILCLNVWRDRTPEDEGPIVLQC